VILIGFVDRHFVNVEGAFEILSYLFLLYFSSDLYKIRDRRPLKDLIH